MYSVVSYGRMISDSIRMQAYSQALQHAVTEESVVLDVGTGIGIFALLACAYGARKVYAVEPSDAIHLARELAAANGVADRIEFIQKYSNEAELAEKADIMISDLRGTLPFFFNNLTSVIDARERLLRPGARIIAKSDQLYVSAVHSPQLYETFDQPWSSRAFGMNWEAARAYAMNSWESGKPAPDQMVLPGRLWARIDYEQVEDSSVDGSIGWTCKDSATINGLCIWFDTTVEDGVTVSNAPDQKDMIYGDAFFPLTQPVDLNPGDQISVRLAAKLVGEDYIWLWETDVENPNHEKRVRFRQSTFEGTMMSRQSLAKRAASHVPSLTRNGLIDQLILSLMKERVAIGEIARQVQAQFPDKFPHWHNAMSYVGELAIRYT